MAPDQDGNTQPSPTRVWPYLLLVFPLSWALWIPVILHKTNPAFLNLGGGPALAAMWFAASNHGISNNAARMLAFLVFVPLCWLVVVLNIATLSHPAAAPRFNPWLLLPSAIAAWIVCAAFSADHGMRTLMRGLVSPPNWRWPFITLLILPFFLLTTALVGRILGLPVN